MTTEVKFSHTYNLTECPQWRAYPAHAPPADPPPALPYWAPRTFAVPPAIGTRVHVTMNGFGPATVVGYLVEHGFVGLHVRPDVRPAWHVKQAPGRDVICVYGTEIRPL
jgi:hypothetical protein